LGRRRGENKVESSPGDVVVINVDNATGEPLTSSRMRLLLLLQHRWSLAMDAQIVAAANDASRITGIPACRLHPSVLLQRSRPLEEHMKDTEDNEGSSWPGDSETALWNRYPALAEVSSRLIR
jgi:hypothetical protein